MASRELVPHSKISMGLRGATSTRCLIRTTIVLAHQTEYPKIVSFLLGYKTRSSTENCGPTKFGYYKMNNFVLVNDCSYQH